MEIKRPQVSNDIIRPEARSRFNPDIRNAASTDNSISIFGDIGLDFWTEANNTVDRISAALRSIGDREVVVNINSPGGDFFEGLAIYNALKEHSQKVTVNVLGMAASAASIIAMAGDEVRVARAGFLMIHNTLVYGGGNRHTLRETADTLESFDTVLADIYATRTGIPAVQIATMLDAETWLGGSEAVDKGFADSLLASDEVKEDKNPKASVLRRLDNALARANMPRAERRELIKEFTGTPSAADDDVTPSADYGNEIAMMRLRVASI